MIQKIELKTYWFFNVSLPGHLPKQVSVKSITKNVAVFDDYIVNKKFADVRKVKDSLFNTYEESMVKLSHILSDPHVINFIEAEDIKKVQNLYPEAFL